MQQRSRQQKPRHTTSLKGHKLKMEQAMMQHKVLLPASRSGALTVALVTAATTSGIVTFAKPNVMSRSIKTTTVLQHRQHPCGSSDEEEDDDERCSFGSWDSDSAFDFGSDDCDDDEEEKGNSAGNQQQQHPQQFYKQAAPLLGPTEAFQQLVQFVQGLPNKVKDHNSAAHLKGFASKKVSTLQVQ